MKPEHLKLAGIVTMVCGGMSSLGAGAMGSDSPMVASGRIIPMQSAPQGAAMDVTDAAAQDSTPVTSAATADFPPALDVPPVPAEAGVSVAASAESRDAQPVNATIALAGGGDASGVQSCLERRGCGRCGGWRACG